MENGGSPLLGSMQEFKLFETQSNFYMIGWNGSGVYRVLKIDRLDASELNVSEDSTAYTKKECYELLKRIHEGNKATGGLKLVTLCYGIIGFIKFLGPYYMLVITERREIGEICGHRVYEVSKSEIISLQNSSVLCNIVNSRDENRYKRLLSVVDLTKDFFFSYSYNIMRSFQKNMCDHESGGTTLYKKMFVWNEFLTRGIRHNLRNTVWTVALVYGFFKQTSLSEAGRNFKLTLIARRSRHNAGTRYLKRGINESGNVANDVETEQILSEDVPEDLPMQISSVVQNRGSIPLFWSQETSRMNLKPDIVLSKRDLIYEATRLHFENLAERYGIPIIILNLIKTKERRPRESILRAEFANAIDFINKDLPEENRLRFLHWDLHKHFQSKTANVLTLLGKVAVCALMLTGFFYHQVTPAMMLEGCRSSSSSDAEMSPHNSSDDDSGECDSVEKNCRPSKNVASGDYDNKPGRLQRGVLRTNCIDCLDRTNVAQYAYGWAALGQQLHALGIRDATTIELDDPLSSSLMALYERMGDTLAYQYGGSAAHNKVFSERRGQWRAATQSQEFLRTLQRYYNNTYMDADKQDAINVFLGTFQPEQGKQAVWELRSDSHSNGLCKTPNYAVEYRGVKTKEEKGMEQVEEQRVIEAKIRMRQKEMEDDEEKMQKRMESSCSSSASAMTGEMEYGSASAISYNDPMEDAESASSQNVSVARQRSRRPQGNRDDEAEADLEELMVMEAIWLSMQETGMQRDSGGGGVTPFRQYVSEEDHSYAEPATPSSSSGGLACAISALAEQRQQIIGESSNHNHNVNVASYSMLPGNCDSYYDIEQDADDIDHYHHYNHYQNNTEMGETGSNSSYMNGGESYHNFPLPPPPPLVIAPESFEEQMMMAMAVSLAEVHATTTTSAPTEVTWQ